MTLILTSVQGMGKQQRDRPVVESLPSGSSPTLNSSVAEGFRAILLELFQAETSSAGNPDVNASVISWSAPTLWQQAPSPSIPDGGSDWEAIAGNP